MPRRNGTGPLGDGPKTGKGLGNCLNGRALREIGRGYGNARRCRSFQGNNLDLESEKVILEKRLEEINDALK